MKNLKSRYINVGCGASPTDGFVNYDYNFFLKLMKIPLFYNFISIFRLIPDAHLNFMKIAKLNNIKFCDASRNIPEKSFSVDLIYTCHMIEHLDKNETDNFLKECKRVLKPNGYLRIVVPDFDRLIQIYNENKNVDEFINGSCLVGDKPKNFFKKLQYFLQGHGWHHQMFNQESLTKLLMKHGFYNLIFLKPGESKIPMKTAINLFDFSNQSIYCECQSL